MHRRSVRLSASGMEDFGRIVSSKDFVFSTCLDEATDQQVCMYVYIHMFVCIHIGCIVSFKYFVFSMCLDDTTDQQV